MKKIRVTVWNEFYHERNDENIKALYPDGIHGAIKSILLECDDIEVRTATLDEPENGLTDEVLNSTDVLIWWGHMAHEKVLDSVVEKVRNRVLRDGMGFIPVHSGHHSKVFKAILGTTGDLTWSREQDEIVWNLMPQHPIAAGIPTRFKLFEEMYGEPFFIPTPDELIFTSWYADGNIFRSGCCYYRGLGKIFYFQPGHEGCKSFENKYVRRIIQNAVHWAAPSLCVESDKGCSQQMKTVLQALSEEN